MRKRIVYISGKYANGDTEKRGRPQAILLARAYAIDIWNLGAAVICPHSNSSYFEKDATINPEEFLNGYIAMLHGVDAMFMLPNWKSSKGSKIEYKYAEEMGIPIFVTKRGLKRFLKDPHRCSGCGFSRLTYIDKYRKSYCLKCTNMINAFTAAYVANQNIKFLTIPRL